MPLFAVNTFGLQDQNCGGIKLLLKTSLSIFFLGIPCITDCVMAELEKLGSKYRVAVRYKLILLYPDKCRSKCSTNTVLSLSFTFP